MPTSRASSTSLRVSASEVEYQLLLSHDVKLLTDQRHRDRTDRVTEVKRMLASLIQTLRADR